MHASVERLLNVALTIAAISIAASLVRREFFASSGNAVELTDSTPQPVRDQQWKKLLEVGHTAGDPAAPVQLVIFSDFECPACASFDRGVLAEAKAEFGAALAVTLVHYPLPSHRFARLAAIASECAAAQGRFHTYAEALYATQDSLGLKSWWAIAAHVGVADSTTFEGCLGGSEAQERVTEGTRLGRELAIKGTPGVVVNGLNRPGFSGDSVS